MEHITKVIEDEIQKRVEAKVTKFIEMVAKTYDISIKSLLHDLARAKSNSELETTQCMGFTPKGKRCKFSATHDGYCKKHIHQKKQRPIANTSNTSRPVSSPTLPLENTKLLIDI